ncbi:hypothetical protein F5Y17DRAFT_104557 [Xylariaceae sp. FL0594]|nr:hypothetical protein F5Y17DRAFT_104557 [Xylariaceae sp. FL0594]
MTNHFFFGALLIHRVAYLSTSHLPQVVQSGQIERLYDLQKGQLCSVYLIAGRSTHFNTLFYLCCTWCWGVGK